MKIITVELVRAIIEKHGFDRCMEDLMDALTRDFCNWETFTKMPRPAMHVPGGVLELMPICDNKTYYTFKYVNCHPKNPITGLQTVVATGQISRIDTGYPLMFSEMTILTALRTAATSALATDRMARKAATTAALIGTGAQSEFQIKGLQRVRDIQEVRFHDIDAQAMEKFRINMNQSGLRLTPCASTQEAVYGADIITTVTACKANVDVVKNEWITEGVHINALGGDTVGKTELELSILSRAKIVVEYLDQSMIEGEVQRLNKAQAKRFVMAELHEVLSGAKHVRTDARDITLFDSVGIALEDYSVLRLIYELAAKYDIGEEYHLTPVMDDPKNLFGSLFAPAI